MMASTKKGESNENDNAEETTIAASTTSGLSINRIKNIRRVFIEVAKDESELLRVESLPEALESLGMNDTKNEILNEVKLNVEMNPDEPGLKFADFLSLISRLEDKTEYSNPPSFYSIASSAIKVKLDRQLSEVSTIKRDKIEELKKIFDKIDGSKDGFLTFEEWKQATKVAEDQLKIKFLEKDLKKAFDEADDDENGKIDFFEFLAQWSLDNPGGKERNIPLYIEKEEVDEMKSNAYEVEPEVPPDYVPRKHYKILPAKYEHAGSNEVQEIKKKFDEIDTSSSGTISLKEFKVAMSFLEEEFNEDEIKKMFDEMDINGDGKIDYSEFLLSAGRI